MNSGSPANAQRLSALEGDAEHLLEAYEERREVYKQLDLTVEAHHDGRLEAAWALNASISKVKGRSPPASRVLESCLQLRVAHEFSSCRRSVLVDRTLARREDPKGRLVGTSHLLTRSW
jgi:hypothetical protein